MDGQHEKKQDFWMGSRFYDFLKFLALVALPATSSAYFSLSALWEWTHTEQVMGTIAIVETFLGVVLKLTKSAYERSGASYDGVVNLVPDEVNQTTDLNFSLKPEAPDGPKKQIVFKVNPVGSVKMDVDSQL